MASNWTKQNIKKNTMDSTTYRKNTYGAGEFGSPSTGPLESDRTGSHGSSSCNRAATEVETQAPSLDNATGKNNIRQEVPIDPFQPRRRLERSPGRQHQRSHSISELQTHANWEIETVDLLEDEDNSPMQTSKRKRTETRGTIPKVAKDCMDVNIKNLADRMRELHQLCKSLKISQEFKLSITKVIRAVNEVQRANLARDSRQKGATRSVAETVLPDTQPQTREIATQTVDVTTYKNEVDEEEIAMCKDFESFNVIRAKFWPEGVYARTRVTSGVRKATDSKTDVARIRAENKVGSSPSPQYPGSSPEEEAVLQEQNTKPGDIAYLIRSFAYPGKGGSLEKRENILYHLVVSNTPNEDMLTRDLFTAAGKLRDNMVTNGRQKVMIHIPDKIDGELTRKVLETAFNSTKIEVGVHLVDTGRADASGWTEVRRRMTKPRHEEVVTVKGQGKTFADTLKSLKSNIDLDKEKITVKGVRSTQKGDLMLIIKGDGAEAAKLGALINSKIEGLEATRVTYRGPRKTIHLRNLECCVGMEDVRRAITTKFPDCDAGAIEVKALRPAANNRQNVTVTMPAKLAEDLVADGKIRVGWSECTPVHREEIVRCYKCWGYNHLAKSFNGKDRSKACRRCGEDGHEASKCPNNMRCVICEKEGHMSGGLRCPLYLKARAEAKGRRRGETGDSSPPKRTGL